ncbi:hypothetical protein JS61_05175 [Rickettsia felis]|uniref:hypothetical protein n=1 Tax=Rickettsia felis TaxID=42862 RepID=UPI000573F65E|nr:hypothetical protein [Rickettsia felis]KHO03473.1 hypothetical protein JS61_05175 [Rickettsia felis]
MAIVLHGIHKKAELSPLEKIYTTITGQSQEEYQAKKVEKILTMEHPNYKVIDDTKSYKSSLQTPTPVQIKQEKTKLVKQALNTPVKAARSNQIQAPTSVQTQEKAKHVRQALNTPSKAPPKPARNFKTPNQTPNTSKDSSKQHER